jgi:CDP-glucose 4,6-dehydratase
MHFLITGHTGFKGAWLSMLLQSLGHTVAGYSVGFEKNSLYELLRGERLFKNEKFEDIRDLANFTSFLSSENPDVLVHFAAQSLVRESYRNPEETFEVNVIGTLNCLQVARSVNKDLICLVITTDKVYKSLSELRMFVEEDPLEGSEPYGRSKAIADLAANFWMSNGLLNHLAIARAGNVIGGGDVCPERLLPDLIAAYSEGRSPVLRSPTAVRPWQHVLDCLNGYLTIVNNLANGGASDVWNIGPDLNSHATVKRVQEITGALFKQTDVTISQVPDNLPETQFLGLNSEKIRTRLGWSNIYDLPEAIERTVTWHSKVDAGMSPFLVSIGQIEEFLGRISTKDS